MDEHGVGDNSVVEKIIRFWLLHFLLKLWVKRNEGAHISFGSSLFWSGHVPELLVLTSLELGQDTV